MNHYDRLIERLDAFIRRYYANQLLRGTLILLTCILFYVLVLSVSEYFLYLPSWLRITALCIFVLMGLGALVVWIIRPLAGMARLGKVISHEQAAVIIGKHFPEVSDKLLNILQLKQQNNQSESSDLIAASIDQKADQIRLVPIVQAIDFSKNRKYLPYLLPLVLTGIFILVASPDIFREASERLLQPSRTFERPAPFKFVILNPSMQAVRNSDFTLLVKTTGNARPAEMFLDNGTEKLPMAASGADTFSYTIKNITEPLSFRLYASGFYSAPHILEIVRKPVLKAFKVQIAYPSYTGKKEEERSSLGDMTLPEGTTVRWGFMASYTDEALLRIGPGEAVTLPQSAGMFGGQYRFLSDTAYTIVLRNRQNKLADSFQYKVQVLPDQYPVIQLQEFRDTVSGTQVVLTGTAGDDYGISRVLFHYGITDEQNRSLTSKSIPLAISGGLLTTFKHYFDIQALQLQPGQKLSYYVEAWDNDGVHGSKAVRSEIMTYQMYNVHQVDSAMNANARQINAGISSSAQQGKELQEDYKEMQSRLLNSDKSQWEQQRSLKDMLEKQMQLQNQLQSIQKRFEEQIQQSKQKEYSDDVREKQAELQKQLENVLNKELQEQMKKLQDLLQKLNQPQSLKNMQQMEQDNKLFNMDMQRIQELMKQLEMQMKLEDMAGKIADLSKKQLELKEQTEQGKKDNQQLDKEQRELQKQLDSVLNKDMQEAKELNEKSPQKQDLQPSQDKGQEAREEMQQSSKSLQQNQKSKSSQSQQKSAERMQEMADILRAQASGLDMEQIEMDIRAVRQILSNLIRLSFDQEKLMNTARSTSPASAAYLGNMKEQNRLLSNSRMIRDSLFVLSKRLSKLSVTVNKETTELEKNMMLAVDGLEDRRVAEAVTRQQYVMTHTNNLALMLNEILQNLIQQQSQAMQQKPGSGSCNKPGGSNPKPGMGKQLSDIITKQQQLGNSMQQMGKDGKQQGQQPGGQKEGGQQSGGQSGGNGQGNEGQGSSNGEYGNAEQLARYAAQQAAIRRQLQQLNSLLNSKGMGNSKDLQDLQKLMDKNETDLVNRRITAEFLLRQKEIMTRLLEAEKSLREQEQDDKRASNAGKELTRPVPPELQRYLQNNTSILDLYKTVPPQLKPYFKSMVDKYYQMISN